MNDTTLTESKDAEREYEEAVAQLEQDNKSQFFKGVGVLVLLLVGCLGFVGGALFVAKEIGLQVNASFGVPSDETLSTRPGQRP